MYRRLSPKQREQRQRKLQAMKRGKERAAMAREPRGRMPELPQLRREIIVTDFDTGDPVTHTMHLYRSDRVDCYRAVADGRPWKDRIGWLFDAGRHEEAERVLKLVGDMEDAALARMCRKCGGAMKPGIATEQTTSISDEGTCSTGGPGRVIDCMKCSACGWSVTA